MLAGRLSYAMIVLLSPAKSLDLQTPLPTRKRSLPRLLEQSEQLVEVMQERSPDELSALMGISADLGALNAQRFADFSLPFTAKNARPAALMFDGDVYQGMAARARFGERDWTEAQKSVRILSGLYGLLRPLDLVQPYRLEMGTTVPTSRGRSLYDFWGSQVTSLIASDLADSPGADAVVNLASEEYAKAVRPQDLSGRFVSPRFLDADPSGRFRIVSFFAKRARGEMAAWLVLNRIRSVRALPAFDAAGYRFDPERSTPDQPTFVRAHA